MCTELFGPLLISYALGMVSVLRGKFHFGYIFGFGVFGSLMLYFIVSLLSYKREISYWTLASILGYHLIPVIILSALDLIFELRNFMGLILSLLVVFWSTYSSSTIFVRVFSMQEQSFLVSYPIVLLYSLFVLITIF